MELTFQHWLSRERMEYKFRGRHKHQSSKDRLCLQACSVRGDVMQASGYRPTQRSRQHRSIRTKTARSVRHHGVEAPFNNHWWQLGNQTTAPYFVTHFYIEDVCFDSKSSPRLVSLTTGRWLYSTNKIHLARPLGYALSIVIIATNLLPSKSIFQERKPTPNNFTRRFPFWNLRQKIFIFLTQNSHRKPLPITG